ncbi:MAG: hypothetical protein EAZ85_10925 [Bacteroidetes bacterium]|nr:MAG: hypothetical protein EAZ85_10925 [Bacteroidota bacterium]TAG94499.1 MAG: hypothetical protein EAZ20_00835 [Bacteroidota bacterium]
MSKQDNDKKYSFADIVDFIFALGGIGFGVGLLFLIMTFNRGFYVPKPALLIDLLAFFMGGLGTVRLLLRQKQNKIDELEELLPPQRMVQHSHYPENNLPSHSSNNPNVRIPISTYEADLEVRFLEALVHKKNRITLVEAVILVRESIDKLLPVIEKLQKRGIIGTEIEENGQIVYVTS